MRPSALYLSLILLLSPIPSWAEDDDKSTPTFPYTLAELEELLDSSPQLRLLSAKQQEARNKESIWHDVSVSAGFNPIRTADKFTDRIRIGFAVSMPLDILLFRDTARVSREVEGLELHKLHGISGENSADSGMTVNGGWWRSDRWRQNSRWQSYRYRRSARC